MWAVMMALLKIARIAKGRFKADSYIDAIGYMACAGELAETEALIKSFGMSPDEKRKFIIELSKRIGVI